MSSGTKIIHRSSGLNTSERFLARLCDASFLSLWSYPNVFRKPAKELCDVLVVFQDHVLLFSDKRCSFPNTGNPQLDWARWYRHALEKSMDQLRRAAQWVLTQPSRVFTDSACKRPLPVSLPSGGRGKVHRIAVANGAAEACRKWYGGTGSFVLAPLMPGVGEETPFTVSGRDTQGQIVHILNEATLELVLGNVDTIADFVAYLEAKEGLLEAGGLLTAAGEEEVLAVYLRSMVSERKHGFPMHGADVITIEEGHWSRFVSSKEYAAKRLTDRLSYTWDKLIEEFARNLAAGTLIANSGHGLQDMERALRVLASESRLQRRMLAGVLLDLARKTALDQSNTRVILSPQRSQLAYVFVIASPIEYDDYEQYRSARRGKMIAYCNVVKYLNPMLEEVLAIGIDSPGNRGQSEDLALLDARQWTPEQQEEARRLHEEAGLLQNVRIAKTSDNEYPKINAGFEKEIARKKRNERKRRQRDTRAGRRK